MKLVVLYPSDALNSRQVDDSFAPEYSAMRDAGIVCHVFSQEDLERGAFRARPPLAPGDQVLYRGWMLATPSYTMLANAVSGAGAGMVTTPEQYCMCHHLPGWYSAVTEWTAETVVLPRDTNLIAVADALGWGRFFVKDYVKSLNTKRGSIAETPREIDSILAEIEKYRGEVEGGVCLRRVECFRPNSERRFFVMDGRAFAADGEVPGFVHECAGRLKSRFFSIDVAERDDGIQRVIEIGDGQVSDRKHWPAERFAEILGAWAASRH